MAKGSFLSVKRGKIGDIVGYQVTNSADKDKQGWRPYQPKVRNPQSDGQMVQRCKMAAVNNLYRALKDVIRRGFENHKYGDESRRAWLKVALGQDFSTGPWVVKGSMQPVPIKTVPITVGSLPQVAVTFTEDEYFATNIQLSHSASASETVGDVSQWFIGAGYHEGDQVTVITGWVPMRLSFAWVVRSFYLNLSDTTPMKDLGIFVDTNEDNYLQLMGHDFADAVAIAVSRDGDGTNLRSTSYAATNPTTVDAVYYGEAMYEMAKRSYMQTESTRDSNWPIQPGTRGAGSAYIATRGDGTTFVPVEVSLQGSGYTSVEDPDGNLLYVKCTDVTSTVYNGWLKGKSGSTVTDVWSTTEPAELETDQWCKFNAGNQATDNDLSFFNYLVANGYNARNLLGLF